MSIPDSGVKWITAVCAAALVILGVVFIVKDWKESQKNLGSALITGAAVTFASLFVQLHADDVSDRAKRQADEAARQADLQLQIALASDLTGFDFRKVANVPEAERVPLYLSGKKLRDATFTDLDLRGWKFRDADLRGATLDGAKLQRADLINAELTGASLKRADLTRASLQDAELNGTIMTATFTGAEVDEQTCWPPPEDGKGVTPDVFRRDDRFAGISPKLEEIGGVDVLVYGHYCRTKTLIVSDRDRSDITALDGYCLRADECSEAATTPTPTPTPAPPADPELTSPVGQPPETPTTPTPVPTASPAIP